MNNSSRFKPKEHVLRAVAVLGQLLYRRGYRGLSLLQWDESAARARVDMSCNRRDGMRAQEQGEANHD